MKFLKFTLIFISIIFLILALILGGFHILLRLAYYKVDIGMNEKQVNAIFIESDMPLADEQYEQPGFCGTPQIWYGDCEAAKKSGATYFLTYKVFFDTYAIIGFKNGKVIYKGVGDA